MNAKTLLELGRVSNLPTVWSNVLTGAVLSGATLSAAPLVTAGIAGSLFYVGGMFLNDAFDADIDARERPERPIPSGRAARGAVLLIGLGMLLVGILLLAVAAAAGFSPAGALFPLAGLGTAAAVVLYDRFHKGIAWSPIVMGLCRAGLYVLGALAVSATLPLLVVKGAAALLFYVVGLTHIARYETASAVGRLWPTLFLFSPLALALTETAGGGTPVVLVAVFASMNVLWVARALRFAGRGGRNIGVAVVSLIAGIALVDALFAATLGAPLVAAAATLAAILTLAAQKKIRGT